MVGLSRITVNPEFIDTLELERETPPPALALLLPEAAAAARAAAAAEADGVEAGLAGLAGTTAVEIWAEEGCRRFWGTTMEAVPVLSSEKVYLCQLPSSS